MSSIYNFEDTLWCCISSTGQLFAMSSNTLEIKKFYKFTMAESRILHILMLNWCILLWVFELQAKAKALAFATMAKFTAKKLCNANCAVMERFAMKLARAAIRDYQAQVVTKLSMFEKAIVHWQLHVCQRLQVKLGFWNICKWNEPQLKMWHSKNRHSQSVDWHCNKWLVKAWFTSLRCWLLEWRKWNCSDQSELNICPKGSMKCKFGLFAPWVFCNQHFHSLAKQNSLLLAKKVPKWMIKFPSQGCCQMSGNFQ